MIDRNLTRICSKCTEEKPLTKEHFYRQKGAKHGFKYQCKACTQKHDKDHYVKNRDRYINYAKKYQIEERDKRRAEKAALKNPPAEIAPTPVIEANGQEQIV